MNRRTDSPAGARPAYTAPGEGETRLRGRRLVAARALVFAIIAFIEGLYLLALSGLTPRLLATLPCTEPLNSCLMSPGQSARLAELGVAPDALALGITALSALATVVASGVASVLLWRRSDDWMALLVALTLVLMPSTFTPVLGGLSGVWQTFGQVFGSTGFIALALLASLFPSGRFVPRWLWLPVLALSVLAVGPSNWLPSALALPMILGATLCLIAGQIYRYRRASTAVQRQQTKWAVSGLILTFVVNQLFWQPAGWVPALQRADSLYILLFYPDSFLMICILAISFGVAILRYRLYDIDVIIRRTLTYGALTTVLAAIYFGVVLGAQSLTHLVTGHPSEEPLIIVTSTLLIAALFAPLRRHLQALIDRAFYRSKYDADTTLATFGTTLRTETNLADLGERLVAVVHETMRPEHVSLWLSAPDRSPATPSSAAEDTRPRR